MRFCEEDSDLNKTIDDGKRLVRIMRRYLKLEAIDWITVVLSIFIVTSTIIILGVNVIFYICMGLANCMTEITGDIALSYFIIALALALIATIIYLFRRRLITQPILRILVKNMLEKKKEVQTAAEQKNSHEEVRK